MRLLQFAAANIPGLPIYWVAYEQSYAELSHHAQKLIGCGSFPVT